VPLVAAVAIRVQPKDGRAEAAIAFGEFVQPSTTTLLYEVDPTMGDLRVGLAAWPLWSAAAVPRVRNLFGRW
jgi:hypothetical protein